MYFATGLASLVQVRFTELPSSITPGGVHPTEGVSGASVDSYITLVCISKYKNKALGSCKASVMSISKHCIESSLSSLFLSATCRLSFYVAHYRLSAVRMSIEIKMNKEPSITTGEPFI